MNELQAEVMVLRRFINNAMTIIDTYDDSNATHQDAYNLARWYQVELSGFESGLVAALDTKENPIDWQELADITDYYTDAMLNFGIEEISVDTFHDYVIDAKQELNKQKAEGDKYVRN